MADIAELSVLLNTKPLKRVFATHKKCDKEDS
jgi:hypothetical protein